MKKNFIIMFLLFVIIVMGIYIYKSNDNKNEKVEKVINTVISDKDISNNIIEDKELNINKSEVSSETDLVNYLEDVSDEVDSIVELKEIDVDEESKIKNTFILLTDFIFYDGEIKGKKFNDLTSSCKEKVLDIYSKIDSKIESRFPDYKNKIKSTSKKVYVDVKEKVIDTKNKILEDYKNFVGEESYNSTGEYFEEDKERVKEVYDTYKPYIESGKEKAKSTYESAKEKISNWYQGFKES